jgi:hypothetical protein
MKRSEALSIIWDAINELEDGNYILTKLEEAGMLPPGRYVAGTEDTIDPIMVHEWEPEENE